MFDSQYSRPRENLVRPSKCQLGVCRALQSANQKSSVGKGKHAHACMPPGIEMFYQELPWNSMSLRDSEDGMAVPMRPQVQGYSSIRHASHQPEGRIGGRDVFSKRDHTEVANAFALPKRGSVATVTFLTRTDVRDINHFIFVSPIPYTQPRTFPTVKALTTMIRSAATSTVACNRRDRLAPPQRHSAHCPPQ